MYRESILIKHPLRYFYIHGKHSKVLGLTLFPRLSVSSTWPPHIGGPPHLLYHFMDLVSISDQRWRCCRNQFFNTYNLSRLL